MNTEQNTKKCSKCQVVKPFSDFNPNKGGKFGLRGECKICTRKYQNERYKIIRDDKLAKQKARYDRDPSIFNVRSKRWYSENREKHRKTSDKWLNKNREHCNQIIGNRLKNDETFHIMKVLRSRLKNVLKYQRKSQSTKEFLGCSPKELCLYLEKRFLPGMTWKNHGFGKDKWNVDHILPCAIFDFSDPVEQKQCFHYSNLQPLWQVDNFKKGESTSQSSGFTID